MSFWSGELLAKELPYLICPYDAKNLDCASYRLSVGAQAFVTTPDMESQGPDVTLIKNLGKSSSDGAIRISPGQFAFLLTEEEVKVPRNAIAMISIRAGYKFKGLINVSGFHVDPGWSGKLIFSVYNAGTKTIILRRGEPVFLIVYAYLDRDSDKYYQGKALHQKEIDVKLVEDLTSVVFNPQALKNRVDEVNQKLASQGLWQKYNAGMLSIIAIVVAVIFALPTLFPGLAGSVIANALNSAGYKLVTNGSQPPAESLPLVNNVTLEEDHKKKVELPPAEEQKSERPSSEMLRKE